ncbi:polysaccharide deacetylase family protein [Alisedimentitalea sp. MJ-SS2]|uniref:polysaccharide deacetylase family protein n=1 Tax=Aliisedimentitalea sp. MJ-SS2 TaxID=3049795 RepID=UPI0029149A17|nr:polysaccharide deacetylase family protein [Alisedimentitalea sp. MJ-SS2]MDU8929810.1 polysaccharide deacetylase family protein [Alisedimentitalea sp. MJ-SS2]
MSTPSALCLTFDDNFVDSWHQAAPLFEKYGARVTFFLCWPERITPKQRDLLMSLQDMGHEIGFHTRSHVRLPKYLQTHSLEDYVSDQIDDGLDWMHKLGLSPRSFSFPYFRFRPKLIEPLLERFDILRLEGPYDEYQDSLSPRWGNRTVNTYCFTDKTGMELSNAYFADRFEWLRQHGGVGVTCGHFIGATGNKFARMRCTEDDLEGILALARAYDFEFTTMSELAAPQPKGQQQAA